MVRRSRRSSVYWILTSLTSIWRSFKRLCCCCTTDLSSRTQLWSCNNNNTYIHNNLYSALRRQYWIHVESEAFVKIIQMPMFIVLSSWQSHCESSPGSSDKCRIVPGSRRPSDQARWLRLWVRLYRLPESTPTVTVHYYYSARKVIFILLSHGG